MPVSDLYALVVGGRQVWDQRFFGSGFGPELGGKLLEEIIEGMTRQHHRFGVYSGMASPCGHWQHCRSL